VRAPSPCGPRSPVVCYRPRVRDSGSLFAPGSGGSWLAGAPDSRGPRVAAPDRAAGPLLAFAPDRRVAAALRSLLVSVLLLPAAVVLGQVLRVLLLPALHARLAVRSAAALPGASATELRSRLLLPALRAALQVIRGRQGKAGSAVLGGDPPSVTKIGRVGDRGDAPRCGAPAPRAGIRDLSRALVSSTSVRFACRRFEITPPDFGIVPE
jgi:hypothetical protein